MNLLVAFSQLHWLKRCVVSQQRERGFKDALLLRSVVGATECRAALQAREGCTRRQRQPGYTRIPTGQGGRDTVDFKGTCNQSNGLGTDWSGRYQQRRRSRFGARSSHNRRDQLVQHPAYIRLVTHKADHVRRQGADLARGSHVFQVA